MTLPRPTHAPTRSPAIMTPLRRLAVAVDGEAADDAFALARALARSSEADLVAMTVIPDLSLIAPWAGADLMRDDAEQQLRRMRDTWHPRARIAIDRDRSVARGLCRMVALNHRELLVVGSSHRAEQGTVRLSGYARQLIGQLACPLVLAPRGLASGVVAIRRIAVGVDDSTATSAVLAGAVRFAATTDAELLVCSVVDDTPPAFGMPSVSMAMVRELWQNAVEDQVAGVEAILHERAAKLNRPVTIEVRRGAPAEVLTKLSEEVDLLVIGSRRWGPLARLVLGGTGEALAHGSRCPLVILPRPTHDESDATDDA